jgi:outer membrane protein assembly factor BamE (lipoprotein component of BamABCDE complex)
MISGMDNFKRSLARATLVVGVCLLSGCIARVDTRGNEPDPELLASMESKKATQNEVVQILGSPSSIAMFENETWFYISELTETVAFFEPEVMDRQIVILEFDTTGSLQKVRYRELKDGQEIELVDRETPTLGIEDGFLQQLLGNLGRFNK